MRVMVARRAANGQPQDLLSLCSSGTEEAPRRWRHDAAGHRPLGPRFRSRDALAATALDALGEAMAVVDRGEVALATAAFRRKAGEQSLPAPAERLIAAGGGLEDGGPGGTGGGGGGGRPGRHGGGGASLPAAVRADRLGGAPARARGRARAARSAHRPAE